MQCSPLTALALACASVGCVRESQLGDARDDSCRLASCDAGMDARAPDGPRDAGALAIGDARFSDPADASEFVEIAQALVGLWHGVADSRAQGSDGESFGPPFELRFSAADELGRAGFEITCLERPGCDPFGRRSSAPDADGQLKLIYVSETHAGEGELEWTDPRFGPTRVRFWAFRLRAQADTLAFTVGFPNSPVSVGPQALIALARGPWPPHAGILDAGDSVDAAIPADAASSDAAPSDSALSDGAPSADGGP